MQDITPFLSGLLKLNEDHPPADPNRRRNGVSSFLASIDSPRTRESYTRAVRRFLAWTEHEGLPLGQVPPHRIRTYLDDLRNQRTGEPLAAASGKLHLAAIRRFCQSLVETGGLATNPALSVRGPRLVRIEGATVEMSRPHIGPLLAACGDSPVGVRDRAILGVLAYTGVRVSAACRLEVGDFQYDGTQHHLRFLEKGGRDRRIPVRHDLEIFLQHYLTDVLQGPPRHEPLFRAADSHGGLSGRRLDRRRVWEMVKRRCRQIGLPDIFSPHGFRVAVINDLLSGGAALEDVQYLAGHADCRTTRTYSRQPQEVARNLVERIRY